VRKDALMKQLLEQLNDQLLIMLLNIDEQQQIEDIVKELLESAFLAAREPNFDIHIPLEVPKG
jgi:AcrR family transcriptional regulator